MQILDYISIGVLALFLGGYVLNFVSKKVMPPGDEDE